MYLLLAPLLEYYLVSLLVLVEPTARRLLGRGRGRVRASHPSSHPNPDLSLA